MCVYVLMQCAGNNAIIGPATNSAADAGWPPARLAGEGEEGEGHLLRDEHDDARGTELCRRMLGACR